MFIEISPHKGVFDSSLNNPLKRIYRLNLNFVLKVFFETEDAYEDEVGWVSFDEDEYKAKKITLNKITFELITGEHYHKIVLLFSTLGHGEYQRIKRIINENTFR
jgi:hypothetical protein